MFKSSEKPLKGIVATLSKAIPKAEMSEIILDSIKETTRIQDLIESDSYPHVDKESAAIILRTLQTLRMSVETRLRKEAES